MAFTPLNATEEDLQAFEEHLAAYREQRSREGALEKSRESEPKQQASPDGLTTWTYAVIDGLFARIVGCETQAEELQIPQQLDGLPVLELGDECCARLKTPRRIECPDDIEYIGRYAFRLCPNLQEAVLPATMDTFDTKWLARCPKLRTLTLPDKLPRIEAGLFEDFKLDTLRIGSALRTIETGSFAASKLQNLELSPHNPFLTFDGNALYAVDAGDEQGQGRDEGAEPAAIEPANAEPASPTRLVAMAVQTDTYAVAPGCTSIADKAFAMKEHLHHIQLPQGLQAVGNYAFFKSGVREVELPSSVREVGSHAFFRCRSLQRVTTAEGLRVLGEAAFAQTAIQELTLPSTVDDIGEGLVEGSKVALSGETPSFSIATGSALVFDGAGGLYRRSPEGLRMVRLLDPTVTAYSVMPGTISIGEKAFFRCRELQSVQLPEGLVDIGTAAFSACQSLESAPLPQTLQRIGDNAFYETQLAQMHIPAALRSIGTAALATWGAVHGDMMPALRDVQVSPDNPVFYVTDDLLVQRTLDGSKVLLYLNNQKSVRVPDDTTCIGVYAFATARRLNELFLTDAITSIETHAFDLACVINHLNVRVAQPIEGHTEFDMLFPDSDYSIHETTMALNNPAGVDVRKIMRCYDTALEHRSDGGGNPRTSGLYFQSVCVLKRLSDPVFLTDVKRRVYAQMIESDLDNVCLALGRHDDRASMDAMLDLGFVNGDNIMHVIDVVGTLKDAAMTGYLLEVRRKRFGGSVMMDFDL